MKNGKIEIPDQDGGILTIPDPEDIPQYIETNRNIFSAWSFNIGGIDAKSFREIARGEASELSNKYTANFSPKPHIIDKDTIVIETGHQPGLSHPGIIAKYLLMNNLINKNNYAGLNLIVDSDNFQDISLYIPNREKSTIPLLSLNKPIPFETAEEIDADRVNQFLDDIDESLSPPYLNTVRNNFVQWKKEVKNNPSQSSNLTTLLTHLRRIFTRGKLGELPISLQSEGTTFLTFFLHIVQDAERFTQIYNSQLSLYRKVNKVRDKAHPFPNLKIDNCIELPFWHITGDERRRIAVKIDREKIYLKSNGQELAVIAADNIGRGIEILREKGLKIRPNGLTTTMFNRMFIANLFVHGIGGAKYDLATDAVIREFFAAEPPLYATITMTKYPDVTVGDKSERIKLLEDKLRNIEYNPDRYVDNKNPLVADKKRLLLEITKQHADKKSIGKRISAINQALLSILKEEIKDDRIELDKLKEEMEINSYIRRRDYPYFFFKAAKLNELIVNNIQSGRTK
ncbi:MAG: hypothetical protein ABIJ24_03110 [Nitrospinota bacterium]